MNDIGSIERRRALFSLASGQLGYFTLQQAEAIGYAKKSSSHYYTRSGEWESVLPGLGVYRLSGYPMQSNESFAAWSLWTLNAEGEPDGVISHESALAAFNLSDIMPYVIHMSVPPKYGNRRRIDVARNVVVFHGARLRKEEIMECAGYNVTRPLRTITDLLKAKSIDLAFLDQAFEQGYEQGLIGAADDPEHYAPRDQKRLLDYLKTRCADHPMAQYLIDRMKRGGDESAMPEATVPVIGLRRDSTNPCAL